MASSAPSPALALLALPAIALLAPGGRAAAPEAPEETGGKIPAAEEVRSLLEARGLPGIVESLHESALTLLEPSGCEPSWRDAVGNAFAPELLLEATLRELARRWDPERGPAARRLWAGQPGLQLRRAEAWMRATARPPGRGGTRAPAGDPGAEGPREQLLARLAGASEIPATAASLQVRIKGALRQGCGGLHAGDANQRSLLETLERLERAGAQRSFEAAFASAARRAYESFSAQELRAWVREVESPPARWLAEALRESLLAALDEGGRRLEPSPL